MLKKAYYKVFLRAGLFFGILFAVFFINQYFKHKTLASGRFFLCNKGVSFGLFLPEGLFWLLTALALFFIALYCSRLLLKKCFVGIILVAVAFVLGGVLSNLFDRLTLGCVLDYIVLGEYFPFVFNIADASVSFGVPLLLFFVYKNKGGC
jgi:lipoprotein signal peptidase